MSNILRLLPSAPPVIINEITADDLIEDRILFNEFFPCLEKDFTGISITVPDTDTQSKVFGNHKT
ncbi:MAG: hypothetical protein V3V48_03725 [Candidatus Aminicenantaceae bacterium]